MTVGNILSRPALLMLCFTSACAAAGGDWPSLRTRAEHSVDTPTPVVTVTPNLSTTPQPENTTPDANAQSRVQPFLSRIEQERRAFNFTSERWRKQQAVLIATLATVRIKGPADIKWSKAQSELTRLNQIAAELDDALTIVNGATGQLAVLSVDGAAVTTALQTAGKLIKSIEIMQKEAATANANARRKL